jgi:hypothetical protein
MYRFLAALTVLSSLTSAQAAEVTRVASSFEDKHPFGMFLDFGYQYTRDRGKITREWYQSGKTEDVTELRYLHDEQKLGINAHLGISQDLELHVGLPIILQDDRAWGFAKNTDADNTTLYRNCVGANGSLCDTPGFGTGRLFEISEGAASYRGGLGNLTVGLAWAPYVQAKDDTKPTWVLRFDYEAPTAPAVNPSAQTRVTARGPVGDRTHRYTFSTALAKKLAFAEPYFGLHYTLPWRGPGWYSNCDSVDVAAMGHPENCGRGEGSFAWTREQTGLKPAHVGGFLFGAELTLYQRADHAERLALDLRGWGNYVSEGRTYNELSDLFGKLMYSSDHGQAGVQLGIIGQAAEFLMLRAYTSLAYNSERFLSYESVGRDLNGNGAVDVSSVPVELNPTFDFRVDRVGRRFRMEEQVVFRIAAQMTFNF